MDYKPVHIVTNQSYSEFIRAVRFYHVEIVTASQDFTAEEGLHYHYLIHWPSRYNASRGHNELKPSKTTFIRGARRLILPRCACYNKSHNTRCPVCKVFYKLIWCKSDEHAKNCFDYIERKIELHPEWKLQ